MMAVTNLENGQFSDAVGEAILNDTSVQDVLLDHIIEAAGEYGFQDIHFDFEYLRPEDREPYNAFLKKGGATAPCGAAFNIHCAGPQDQRFPNRPMVYGA